MKVLLLCTALALSGCTTIPAEDRAAVLRGLGEHIEKCDRQYTFGLGGIGAPGFSGAITCRAQEVASPVG